MSVWGREYMWGLHPWLLGRLAARHAILYSLATGSVLNVSHYCDGLVTKWGSFDRGGGINHIFVLGRDYALASSVITGFLVSSKTCNHLGSSITLMCEMSLE